MSPTACQVLLTAAVQVLWLCCMPPVASRESAEEKSAAEGGRAKQLGEMGAFLVKNFGAMKCCAVSASTPAGEGVCVRMCGRRQSGFGSPVFSSPVFVSPVMGCSTQRDIVTNQVSVNRFPCLIRGQDTCWWFYGGG